MNAVLQGAKDQGRFQGIRESRGDPVQELFGGVGWEVSDEPRRGADGVRNLPRGPNCTLALVTEWVEEISAYIKGLDPWHLIGVGDEGVFNEPRREDWVYNGTHGVDTEAFVKLDAVDFGTYHIYCASSVFFPTLPSIWTKLTHLTSGSVDQNRRLDTTMARRPRHSTTSSW